MNNSTTVTTVIQNTTYRCETVDADQCLPLLAVRKSLPPATS